MEAFPKSSRQKTRPVSRRAPLKTRHLTSHTFSSGWCPESTRSISSKIRKEQKHPHTGKKESAGEWHIERLREKEKEKKGRNAPFRFKDSHSPLRSHPFILWHIGPWGNGICLSLVPFTCQSDCYGIWWAPCCGTETTQPRGTSDEVTTCLWEPKPSPVSEKSRSETSAQMIQELHFCLLWHFQNILSTSFKLIWKLFRAAEASMLIGLLIYEL